MFFLKKLTSRINAPSAAPTPSSNSPSLEESNTPSLEQDISSEVLNNRDSTPDPNISYETSTLLNKFLRNQKLYSGPEAFYEDEAWAPEYQPVRLFHRQVDTTEEQISSPSDPQ